MPSSIPYDHPSLVLGNIVDPALLGKLKQINVLQTQIDAAQDRMNSGISMKRSLEMTINELASMNVDITSLEDKIKETDAAIVKAAGDYVSKRISNEASILSLRQQVGEDTSDGAAESPVDYSRTEIKKMPLSSDSLKMDAQFFSYDTNEMEDPSGTVASIEKYIKESTGGLGAKTSAGIASAASAQIKQQRSNHNISGTLVITASCTHKNALLLSPLVLDADKAISVWNSLYSSDPVNTSDAAALKQLEEQADSKNSISIISGAAYGSSFVGMVHVLKNDAAGNSGTALTDAAAGLQERFNIGNWLQDLSGGFGVDFAVADNIKNLLNAQKVTSHITMVVMGTVPSLRSNQLQMGVRSITDTPATKLTTGIAAIENATSAEKKTVDQSASSARTGAKMLAMQGSTIQNVMQGLGKIDQVNNKVLDINSLMTAFEDYLQEVKKGDSGVPVQFYLKNISKKQLAKLWVDKYYSKPAVSVTQEPSPVNKPNNK